MKVSSHQKTKDAYIHLRVNSGFKELLQEYAENNDLTVSELLLSSAQDVITNKNTNRNRDHKQNTNVITNKKHKTAAFQLIELFDKVFSLDFSAKNKNKLIDIIGRTIDTDLIDELKEEMRQE
jgi:uncharacterized protein (DUF1778 family)